MGIVFGTMLLGKVDKTPSGYFIATSFFHIFFVPVIPLGSYLVTEHIWPKWEGISIGWNKKSLLIGYLRGISAIGIFVFAMGLSYIVSHYDHPHVPKGELIAAGASAMAGFAGLVTMILSYVFPHVSKAKPDVALWMENLVETASREKTSNNDVKSAADTNHEST